MSEKTPAVASSEIKAGPRDAYRGIIRYIHAQHIEAGDRLPTHSQLQKELGVGNDVLSEAMSALVTDGVLVRRRRVGTILCDLSKAAQMVWSVGLTQHEHQGFGFAGILDYHLRKLLVQRGCCDRTFFRPVPPRDRPHYLDDFHGLAEAVQGGMIDAVITAEDLQTDERVLVCHLSANKDSVLGCRLDENAFLHLACGSLALRGCKRLAWARTAPVGPYSQKRESESRQCLTQLRREGLHVDVIEYKRHSIEGGREIAEQCMAMSPKDRPDGLILMDDYVVMGLTDRLKDQKKYQPHIAGLTNRQAPLLFSLPVIRFEQDIEVLARTTVDLVMGQLMDPASESRVLPYQCQLVAGDKS